MNEKNTIKDLENQAKNTKYLMDKLNKAAYGMTMDEVIKNLGQRDAMQEYSAALRVASPKERYILLEKAHNDPAISEREEKILEEIQQEEEHNDDD